MTKDLFIPDKAYTFQEAADLIARAILSMDDKNKEVSYED